MRHMPPLRRPDIRKRWNMEIVDYAQLMYRTRLITCTDNYWAAWSEDDKAEDYHPNYNPEIMRERYSDVAFYDPDYEITPLYRPDYEKESLFYKELSPEEASMIHEIQKCSFDGDYFGQMFESNPLNR